MWPDEVADRFIKYLSNLQAEVRTNNVQQQLLRHLPHQASIVDIGGGDGRQSIPLARAGHHVTIVDPSPAMLAHAARRLEAEDPDVIDRVQLVEGSAESSAEILGGSRFGAVLCHGVICYCEDPRPLVTSLCDLAAPGGLVSIVAKNAGALTVMAAHDGRWKEVIKLFDADHVVSGLGVRTRADTVEGLCRLVEELGCTVEAWYGVYYFTQGTAEIPRQTIADDDFTAILAAELEASRRDPYRQLSNLFHLVGRRS